MLLRGQPTNTEDGEIKVPLVKPNSTINNYMIAIEKAMSKNTSSAF
jgi:hypothetical protein